MWYGEMIAMAELRFISQAVISDWTCLYPCCDLEAKCDPWLIWHPERARNMWLAGTKSLSLVANVHPDAGFTVSFLLTSSCPDA